MSIDSALSAALDSYNALPRPVKALAVSAVSVAVGAVASGAVGSLIGIGRFTYIATTCAKAGALAEVINRITCIAFKSIGRREAHFFGVQLAIFTSIIFIAQSLSTSP